MAIHSGDLQQMNIFLQGPYKIPVYQRAYAWESEEIEDFWEDIQSTKRIGGASVHFLGQIVVHEDEDTDTNYIIDGQQRTITSMIFASSLRHMCKTLFKEGTVSQEIASAADNISNDITSKCLGKFDLLKKEPHLMLGDTEDDSFFQKHIVGGEEINKKPSKASCERMRRALFFFNEQLDHELSKISDKESQLRGLNDYFITFTERFKVMKVGATKLEEAFVIFETLNARGKALETSDLLKNFIFKKSQKGIDYVQQDWNIMIESLNQSDPTRYIRYYWNCCNDYTQGKELYRRIVGQVQSRRDSEELMHELKNLAPFYHDLTDPSDCTEISNKKFINSLKSLKTMKAVSFYSLILAMKKCEFTEDDMQVVIEAVESLFFRNLTICGKSGSKLERALSKIALSVYQKELVTKGEIIEKLHQEMVGDEEFKSAFALWVGKNSNKELVRYILRKINYSIESTHEINLDTDEVHIEHIMPQDGSLWEISKDIHDEFLWRLGNLTLLSGPINKKLQNKKFEDKKKSYMNSKIDITKNLCKYDEWNDTTITERQDEFSDLAPTIWKK